MILPSYPGHRGHAALRRGRAPLANHAYHLTIATYRRRPVFEDPEAACLASRAFQTRAFHGDATMLAWVLMPDHAHWLLELGERDSLATVVSRLKSASARQVNQALGRKGALWGRAYHDHMMRNDENVVETARYIIANPVRAGLAPCVGDYPYWNTLWL